MRRVPPQLLAMLLQPLFQRHQIWKVWHLLPQAWSGILDVLLDLTFFPTGRWIAELRCKDVTVRGQHCLPQDGRCPTVPPPPIPFSDKNTKCSACRRSVLSVVVEPCLVIKQHFAPLYLSSKTFRIHLIRVGKVRQFQTIWSGYLKKKERSDGNRHHGEISILRCVTMLTV